MHFPVSTFPRNQMPRFRSGGELATGRTIVLVDLENLCGSGDPSLAECQWAQILVASVTNDPQAHVVVAVSHHAAKVAMFAWVGGRILMKSGPNGADLALLEVIDQENVAERFDRVVVASGDGIFADAVAKLAEAGIVVDVVSPESGASKRLVETASSFSSFEQATFEMLFGTAS
jgi:1-aminocyclopropane-1-carboxylate deaminase/D-cysteine desulfhydrase-like pyridoxal-dependent ACC family enzyme